MGCMGLIELPSIAVVHGLRTPCVLTCRKSVHRIPSALVDSCRDSGACATLPIHSSARNAFYSSPVMHFGVQRDRMTDSNRDQIHNL